ncbi:MAG: DUF1285 domain-containing protein [Rhodospirillales bacterium]|nr:MAG: DUF1285 domain-containing protein [Rhodospirillales bacterium]
MRRQGPQPTNKRDQDTADRPAGDREPPFGGDEAETLPIRIARDGQWYYRDSPIRRVELVRLFSTALRRDEAGRYWLQTPTERGLIEVEDAPFTAVELAVEGQGQSMALRFRNNLGEWVTAGRDHPISMTIDADTGEPSPYILIRNGLQALIVRSVFYQLVDLAVPAQRAGHEVLGVWSNGVFFELGEYE